MHDTNDDSHDHHSVPKNWKWPSIPSEKEMDDALIAYKYRDRCVGLLIPFTKCRRDTYYLSWKCEKEKLRYERCLYYDFLERKAAFDRQMKDGKPL